MNPCPSKTPVNEFVLLIPIGIHGKPVQSMSLERVKVLGLLTGMAWREAQSVIEKLAAGDWVVGVCVVGAVEQLQNPNEYPHSLLNLFPPQMFVWSKVLLI